MSSRKYVAKSKLKTTKTKKIDKDKYTDYEKELMRGFNNELTLKTSAVFYASAFLMSTVPFWFSYRIFLMNLSKNLTLYCLTTFTSTYMLYWAYSNTKHRTKDRLWYKDKTLRKKYETNAEKLDWQAITWSIFFNNALFLICTILLSFGVLRSVHPLINYTLTVVITTSLTVIVSYF